jgi:hypothetical protein
MALFMVVEHYTQGPEPVYARVAERGRMLPEGLRYLNSWVVAGTLDTCFQLMEAEDAALFEVWAGNWQDLVTFDIYPVVGSAEASATVAAARSGDPMGSGPRLNWGLLAGYEPVASAVVPQDLARTLSLARDSTGLVARPIERFELAGTLNGHPGHVRSDEAKKEFPAIFALAVAGRYATEPLRSDSRAAAIRALLSWADVYQPTGNPVDEWFFVPLIQAADLVAGTMPSQERAVLVEWVREFALSGDRFYATQASGNRVRFNNWMARRLLIRCVASTVAADTAARAAMPELLSEFVARNYIAGPAGERDGRTFDFEQRDALHYHMAAVQPLVEMTLYAPDLVDEPARAAIASGLEFLRPFFAGEREHVEFAGTSVPFDVARRDDGNPVFRNAPWDPARGRVLLRLARTVFPQVRPWTEQIVDPRYDPRVKLLAAIHGEPQRRAQWP